MLVVRMESVIAVGLLVAWQPILVVLGMLMINVVVVVVVIVRNITEVVIVDVYMVAAGVAVDEKRRARNRNRRDKKRRNRGRDQFQLYPEAPHRRITPTMDPVSLSGSHRTGHTKASGQWIRPVTRRKFKVHHFPP